jgi:hypothetical protein
MELLMCLSCGEFVEAFLRVGEDERELVPRTGECPDCGGTEFKDNDSGRRIQTG